MAALTGSGDPPFVHIQFRPCKQSDRTRLMNAMHSDASMPSILLNSPRNKALVHLPAVMGASFSICWSAQFVPIGKPADPGGYDFAVTSTRK